VSGFATDAMVAQMVIDANGWFMGGDAVGECDARSPGSGGAWPYHRRALSHVNKLTLMIFFTFDYELGGASPCLCRGFAAWFCTNHSRVCSALLSGGNTG
jgi:hypothetical protein